MIADRGVSVRSATAADIPRLAAILAENDEPIGWPDRPGWPYLEHLVDRSRAVVAETRDAVAGFGGSIAVGRDHVRFLTDLFVDPEHQERGVGAALLEALLDGAPGRMTFSSDDERALALYLRIGMRPWWPLLYLAGPVPESDADDAVETSDPLETASWSMAWTGVDRTVDFEHYAALPEAEGFLVWDAGAVAAIGWARRHRTGPGRWLEHATFAPGVDVARIAHLVLEAAADGQALSAPIPGPHPIVPWWLERGGRIIDRDTFCATEPGLIQPERLFPNPGFL